MGCLCSKQAQDENTRVDEVISSEELNPLRAMPELRSDSAEGGPSSKKRRVTEDLEEEPTIEPQAMPKLRGDSASTSAFTASCNTSVEVVGKRGVKRKGADAEGGPSSKRRRVTEDLEEEPTIEPQAMPKLRGDSASTSAFTASCNTSVEVVGKRGVKRKGADAEGGPSSKRRRVTEDLEEEPTIEPQAMPKLRGDSASTSAFTASCNTSVEVVGKRGVKRKGADAEGGPSSKRRRVTEDLEEEPTIEPQAMPKLRGDSASTSAFTASCNTSVEVVGKRGVKRKDADAEGGPSSKRRRVTEDLEEEPTIEPQAMPKLRGDSASTSAFTASCNTSVEVVGKRGVKRKDADAEGGPSSKRRRVTEDLEEEPTIEPQAMPKLRGDSASTSAFTASCNTSVEVVGKRGVKRKDADAEGGPSSKRRRVTEDLEEEPTIEPQAMPKLRGDSASTSAFTEEFEAKYKELYRIGEGGCGSVYAGHRRADNLPVAIKHIPEENVLCKHVDDKGNTTSVEVAVMLKLSAESEGTSPYVSLLDWYQLEKELVLVMERPMPAWDLWNYLIVRGCCMTEEEAKIILRQLVDAALDLESKDIFHRDIKAGNILIETGSMIPRVRLIDFGLSCFGVKKRSHGKFSGSLVPPEVYLNYEYTAGPTTVFQIGAVLYNALHEKLKTLQYINNCQSLPKGMSKDCKDFLQMCLRKDPAARPTLEQLRNHQWLR